MALVGCQKDEVTTPSGTMPKVITASFEQAGGSRVAVDNYGQLTWTAGDSFYLIDKNDNSKTDLYAIKSEGIGQATASFELQGSSVVSEAAYAFYPSVALWGNIDNGELTCVINQDAYLPMLAKTSSATNISFKHLCAALRINFSEIPDGYLYAIIEASSPIKGRFEANLSDAEPVLVAVDGFADKQALYPLTNSVVDMPLPVGTYESLTVKIAKDPLSAEALTLKSWSNLEVKRAKLYTTSASGQVADLSEMPIVEEAQVAAVAEAFTEALANPEVEEIKLPENVQLPMTESISFGAAVARASEVMAARDITIDGNGGTLVWKGASGGRVIDVTNEANSMNLTLKNLTIENKTSYTQRGVNYNTTGKLTLEHVTIKSADNCKITYAINLPGSSDNATVEITNSDICGNIALNLWGENTKVTITNSEIESVDNSAVEGYAAIVLNDDGTTAATGSKITVTGGKIIAKDENGDASTAVQNACIAAEVTISDETEVVGEKLNAVAVILYANTDQYYSVFTLQEAINKASETAGCTLKLIRDITLTNTATIAKNTAIKMDMNGYNLHYAVDNDGKAAAIIANNGDLRIENSSNEESMISFVAADPDMAVIPGYATNTITNEATLYIGAGVKVTNESEGGASYAVDNKGKFTLNGGTLLGNRCALRIATYNQDDVQFQMEGGLVKALTPAWIQLPGNDSSAAPKITVTINGGDFICTKAEEGDVLYTYSFGNSHANTVINIAGGNFLGGTVSIGSGYKGDVPTLNITGGTFDHDVVQWLANDQFDVLYRANANN